MLNVVGAVVIAGIAIILSGVAYAETLVPLILADFYIPQMFYLRTPRPTPYLDTLTRNTARYISLKRLRLMDLNTFRTVGWQHRFTKQSMHTLDYSQKPFYSMYAIQRCRELGVDLVGLFIAVISICVALIFRYTTSQAGLGTLCLISPNPSAVVNLLMSAWTNLENVFGLTSSVLEQHIARTAAR
jgi:hypothetical protein